ncbi:hypothetical protein PHMEG_00034803, partial [Phytophthora megakarya]
MSGPIQDSKWRKEWINSAPRAEYSRPTDAAFEQAERALLDPERDALDKRCAALAGAPQQVSTELCFPMWIPARDLTVTFTDTEIMTSLGSTAQSPLWTKCLGHLRDFKTIRKAGISFLCTDREVCTKLGGESVTICGRKFKVQTYSKYSHWYYVDLQRLPDDVTDGLIYDWFAKNGTPPVYITPAHIVGGLRSRSRRVYFNQKSAPASVMVSKNKPLRQIQFLGHGYTVVHHRTRAYNQVVPPFIKEMRKNAKQARKPNSDSTRETQDGSPTANDDDTDPSRSDASLTIEDDARSVPPAYDDQSDSGNSSDNAAMASDTASEGEPHSGDQSDSESSQRSEMEGLESNSIVVRPKSIWPAGQAPIFPVGPNQESDFAPARILRAKRLVFGTIAEPASDLRCLPPSQKEYPTVSSVNSYEWLSEGTGGTIPPDQDIVLWDRSLTPPQAVSSFVGHIELTEGILNSAVYQGKVEELTLKDLCAVIDEFLGTFDSTCDPDCILSTIQAQPSVHRALLDTAVDGNFQHLRAKAFGHAVLRESSYRTYPTTDDGTVYGRLASLYPDQTDFDFQTVLGQLCPDQTEFWTKVWLAEFDLALQILAPSIYLDPLKLSALLQTAAVPLPHPLWLLWDGPTLGSIIMS